MTTPFKALLPVLSGVMLRRLAQESKTKGKKTNSVAME